MPYKLLLRRLAASALHHTGILELLRDTKQPWRILMYHRITTPEIEGYPLQPGMYVSPEHFDMQMAELKRHYRVLPLDELVDKILKQEPIAPKTVAITFDDGWYDNYQFAFPILRKYELPATIFLATKYIGSVDTFWSDAIPFAIAQLRGKISYQELISNVKEDLSLSLTSEQALRDCLDTPQRQLTEALDTCIGLLKKESTTARELLADKLIKLIDSQKPTSFLRWEFVEEMSKGDISFGCHSHSHQPLGELAADVIEQDLQLSLAEFAQREISLSKVFCYPEGSFSQVSQQVLARHTFVASLSTDLESNFTTTPACLGRVGVHDDMSSTVPLFTMRMR